MILIFGSCSILKHDLGFSAGYWEKGWRVAIICYTRKCIGDYYKGLDMKCGPAVEHCLSTFKRFDPWRKTWFICNNTYVNAEKMMLPILLSIPENHIKDTEHFNAT